MKTNFTLIKIEFFWGAVGEGGGVTMFTPCLL